MAVALVGVIGHGPDAEAAVVTTPLGSLGALPQHALAISDTGQVVGWAAVTSYEDRHAYSWTPGGGMVDLGTLPGTARSEAIAVSNTGHVVGNSFIPPDDPWEGTDVPLAFSWTSADGMVPLGTLGGTWSRATAVNDHGQVVGYSNLADGYTVHAFSWTAETGMVDLGSFDGVGQSTAHDVNNLGQVVGQSARAGGDDHAFLWTADSGMTDLGDLGGLYSYSTASAISESGQVVGMSNVASGFNHAFSWTPWDGMVDLGTLGGSSSYAVGVSDEGHVVGNSDTDTGYPHAFVWTAAEGLVDIPTFGGPIADAGDVNDAGQVVGRAYTEEDELRAFSWTPAGGIVDLGGGQWSHAMAVNDHGVIVGHDGTGAATRWVDEDALPVGTVKAQRADGTRGSGVAVGVCEAPAVISGFTCSDGRNPRAGGLLSAQGVVRVGSLVPGSYTVGALDGNFEPLGAPVSLVFGAGDRFSCLLVEDGPGSSCTVIPPGGGAADDDGVPDAVEDGHPNGGDGNGDGQPDSGQPNVTSLPSAGPDGGYVTITAPGTTSVSSVAVTDPADLPAPPAGATITSSVLSYTVEGLAPGASVDIDLYFTEDQAANSYLKLQDGTWSALPSSAFTIVSPQHIVLHLVDGGVGDEDGEANGVLVDPGAPAHRPYGFSGFRAPVDPLPKVNDAKAGSNVPLKWRLTDPDGTPVSDPGSFVSATFRPRSCASGVVDPLEYTAPSAGLTYQGNGEWHLGWKTSKSWRGCGDLELRFDDGSVHRAAFNFK